MPASPAFSARVLFALYSGCHPQSLLANQPGRRRRRPYDPDRLSSDP